ncbi:sigma-70 family RNA polymerase sigma factor [Fulvivirgaceae bacterium BMA12]|uniref:Sigma-70 family RNA polymerase sigma factor n=1 Tax=Agaribacillus aureus TaxID=3051825 RepID=A0ABT8LAE9_9BACT|nr:sigma-70 family RNA polymerase sigma factor [Fulvivirgaceae bacterium BMA12]
MTLNVTHNKYTGKVLDKFTSSQELWDAFKLGSKEAYAKIYEEHLDALYDYGMHILNNPGFIEDCIHDLYVGLWKNKENLGNPESVKGYLLTSMRRIIFRKVKKERKYTSLPDNSFMPEGLPEIGGEDNLTKNSINTGNQLRLKRALTALTKRQREAIYLRFYHNLDSAEVASVMSISLEGVYNHISKGVGRLKDLLKHSTVAIFAIIHHLI